MAADGTVTIRVGKVELGQGIVTALAQIAAEELDVDPRRIRMLAADTTDGPNEGATSGSRSIEDSGQALRQAAAEVRAIFLREAAEKTGVPVAELEVRDGHIHTADGAVRASYWELAAPGLLDVDATGAAARKAADRYVVVGASAPRLDLPDKVTGRPRFLQDLALPGQLFGRIVRPPSRGATLVGVEPFSRPRGVLAQVRDGNFLGVVAEREETAVRAADLLRDAARWRERPTLPDEAALAGFLRTQPTQTEMIDESAEQPSADAVSTLSATYSRPYLAHAAIGPGCAVARWDGDRLSVWTHSQSIFPLRDAIAQALGRDPAGITVHHVEGAGCYGHNSADDVAFDAVLLARAVPGRPVQVLWSRADELAWAPFGPAMVAELSAGLSAGGRVIRWRHDVWSNGHLARPGYAGTPGLLAATHWNRAQDEVPSVDGAPSGTMGSSRNAVPLYDLADHRVVRHRLLTMPLRTSALRSLGAFLNVFAIESFMDELAAAAGMDPVAFRLAHLRDPRARAVLAAAVRVSGWRPGQGQGVAVARYKNTSGYCAVVAAVEAEHDVRVRRLVAAVDVGQVVNPDGVVNQVEGGAIQSTSWTLKEQVRFDRTRVTSTSWETYPILRFSEVPTVEVEILSRPEEPPLGAGEIAQGPTAAAIGNAVADVLGVRVRDLPITPERIIAAIDAVDEA